MPCLDENTTDKNSLNKSPQICILDAGSQFSKVIDRRIRELSYNSIILPFDTKIEELKKYKGLIISGGPDSVYDLNAPKYDSRIFDSDFNSIPILGICYGMQLMNFVSGGVTEKQSLREDGQLTMNLTEFEENPSKLFHNLPKEFKVLLTHGDSIGSLAPGFRALGKSNEGIIAAIENTNRNLYGLQFHPEVDLTEHGLKIFHNFLTHICKLKPDYTFECRKTAAINCIRSKVQAFGSNKTIKGKKVVVLVSGGVDSVVCALLLKKALPPENVYAIHIDNGFMRLNESSKVFNALTSIGIDLKVINAQNDFYNGKTHIDKSLSSKLCEVISPEIKRKIIGDVFMKVSEKAIMEIGGSFDDILLAQGTLRPDLIESASTLASKGGNAKVIKTHHNDSPIVRKLREIGQIIEPLSDYHKDEVRKLGAELGLPQQLVNRQPFPGPGLAVRIICAKEPFLPNDLQFYSEKLKEFEKEFQTIFPGLNLCLLPVKTVGVQGDSRSYANVVSLSLPIETESISHENQKLLMDLAKRIPHTLHGINRVVFLFGSPISGIQQNISPTYLTLDVIKILQECDNAVNQILEEFGLLNRLSQVPVILFPANFGKEGQRSICIRTFITNDFMTGVPAVPGNNAMPLEALQEIVKKVLSIKGISRVCYDLTPKPPGTTE